MRFLIFAALPVFLLGQAGGVVEGTVVNARTREGIPGVEVTIQLATSRDLSGYSATTDASGAFRVEGIREDGDYRANFGKAGFMPGATEFPTPPAPFHVNAAGPPVHLQLEMTSFPRLSGRVVDGEGHPVPEAAVQLVPLRGGGRPKIASGKDGAFQFDTALPATFVLRAVPPRGFPPPKSTGDEPQVWAPTYYPGVTDQWAAEPIVMHPGDDLDGREIRLRAVPVFHVRGTAVDDRGRPLSGAILKLLWPDSLDARSHAAFDDPEGQTKSAEDGAFDFPAVRPGEWYLIASGKSGGRSLNGVAPITVTKSDRDNIRLPLVVPFSVKGSVERPEGSRRPGWVALLPAWQVRLMAIPVEEGSFEIDEIVPGKYRVALEQPPPGLYIDTVQFGGREALGQTVDVMDAALPLRVVYKANGGRVQGSVEQCERGSVVLLPKEPALQYSEMMHWGRCDAAGRFNIGDLRPGNYYAAAFERLDDLSLYYGAVVDPALIAAIAARGTLVKVEGGQAATVSLKSARSNCP